MVDQPEHDEAIDLCVEAWQDLSTCRPIGMAVGAIPWPAIVQWCEWHEIDHDIAVILVRIIRQLDNDRAEAEASKRRLEQARGGT